jgi:hypothetical protein
VTTGSAAAARHAAARRPQPGELQRDLHSRFDVFWNLGTGTRTVENDATSDQGGALRLQQVHGRERPPARLSRTLGVVSAINAFRHRARSLHDMGASAFMRQQPTAAPARLRGNGAGAALGWRGRLTLASRSASLLPSLRAQSPSRPAPSRQCYIALSRRRCSLQSAASSTEERSAMLQFAATRD